MIIKSIMGMTKVQPYVVEYKDLGGGNTSIPSGDALGFSFTPTVTGNVTSAIWKISMNPGASGVCTLYASSNYLPTTLLGTSTTRPVVTPFTFMDYSFSFLTPVTLTSGTCYVIAIEAIGSYNTLKIVNGVDINPNRMVGRGGGIWANRAYRPLAVNFSVNP